MLTHQLAHILYRFAHEDVRLLLHSQDVVHEREDEEVELVVLLHQLQSHTLEVDEFVGVDKDLLQVAIVVLHGQVLLLVFVDEVDVRDLVYEVRLVCVSTKACSLLGITTILLMRLINNALKYATIKMLLIKLGLLLLLNDQFLRVDVTVDCIVFVFVSAQA